MICLSSRTRRLLCGLALLTFGAQATELNLANQAELEQLKGIGPQLGQRILDERARQGPYADWADFQRRLKGVGPATAQRLSANGLRVAGQPYLAMPAGSASAASAAQRWAAGLAQGASTAAVAGGWVRSPHSKKRSTSSRRASVSARPKAISSRV